MDPQLDALVAEGLVLATKAVRALGLHVSVWSILRWIRHGVRRRRLEAVKVGGRWFTSVEAVRRFLARGDVPQRPPVVRQRTGSSPASERYLESLGLGRARRSSASNEGPTHLSCKPGKTRYTQLAMTKPSSAERGADSREADRG